MEKILLENIKQGKKRLTLQVIPDELKQVNLVAVKSENTIKDIGTDAVIKFIINHEQYDTNTMYVNMLQKGEDYKVISFEIDATIHHMFKEVCEKFKDENMKDILYDILMRNIQIIKNKYTKCEGDLK